MGQVRKIEVSLSEELGDFVSKEVARGHYDSVEDLVTCALESLQIERDLEDDPEFKARLKAAWDEGIASGPPIPVEEVFEELESIIRRRARDQA